MPSFGGSRTIRVQIRVKPGAGRAKVGGRYGADALVVAVQAPPVDGKATQAALRALAKALGCAPREVLLLHGATTRTKTVEIPADRADRFNELLLG